MKTERTLFSLLALIASLGLIPAGRVSAQTFTTLKSFGSFTNVTGYNPQSSLVQGPDGTLYGTTSSGDGSVAGTVFNVQPDGSGFGVLKWFTNAMEGAHPYAGLAMSGSVLYGTTAYGGSSNYGTVFKISSDGTGYTVLKNFAGGDGANPYYAGLTLSGNVLYGTTYSGGSSNHGTLFKLNTDGTGYTVLKSFAYTNGANPNVALTLSGSVLYGTTENGGNPGAGTVFRIATDGTGYAVLKNFTDSPDGAYPDGALTLAGGVLYGTTYRGGSSGFWGTVFKLNTDGTGYTLLHNFAGPPPDGGSPSGRLALSGGVLYGTTAYGGSSDNNGTVFKMNLDGTGYTVLQDFNYSSGGIPYAGLMLSSGVLYGTTTYGGNSGVGAVFKVNTNGSDYTMLKSFAYRADASPFAGPTLSGSVLYGTTANENDIGSDYGTIYTLDADGTGHTVLKNFAGNDGANPHAVLKLSGNVLYGTTLHGGNSNQGTVFQVNTDGTGYAVLKHFTGSDGANPYAALTLSGGVLYGTTYSGGSSNNGTLFRVNTDGTGYAVLKDFTNSTDGASPGPGGLALSGGVLYGITASGGSSGNGTVFKVNSDGTGYAVLTDFNGFPTDGAQPEAGLILSGSVLYGTTFNGGSSDHGAVFKLNTDGTGYTLLKTFNGSDGAQPLGGLTLSGSVLYGTTELGGSTGNGTIFKLNTDGTGYTVLKHFNGSDGASPWGDLALSGSVLYGTTSEGGILGAGTVFSLSFRPQLTITPSGSNVILSWPTNVAGFDYTGYTLQSAPALSGTFTNLPAATNPHTNPIAGPQQFFRLSQ